MSKIKHTLNSNITGELPKIKQTLNLNITDDEIPHCVKPINEPNVKQKINQEIEKPSHYGSKSGQDVIDVAEDFGIIDNAYKFNMLKYLLRGGKKPDNSELQDMLKIRVYNDRYIEKLQNI
jgi:hypothetical protein